MVFFGTQIATLQIGTLIASGLDLYPTILVGIRNGGGIAGRGGGGRRWGKLELGYSHIIPYPPYFSVGKKGLS